MLSVNVSSAGSDSVPFAHRKTPLSTSRLDDATTRDYHRFRSYATLENKTPA